MNYDLDNIATPVRHEVFKKLLEEINYPEDETEFIVNGFSKGFPLEYH